MATAIPSNQAPFTLDELVQATGGRVVATGSASNFVGVAIDSRAVTPSGVFFAIRGEKHDGAHYLSQALARGAGAFVVHPGTPCPEGAAVIEVSDTTRALGDLARYHRERWGGTSIAITGSAGKTTTKELTAAALSGIGARVQKTLGNLNNQFGVPMMVFCLSDAHDTAVFELGTSGRGEIARLGEIVKPDVAVVLLAALAHAAGLGSVEDVADEKASLWSALGPNGIAIVNADDANLCARLPHDVPVLSFGAGEGAQVRLLSSTLSLGGTRARVAVPELGELELHLPLVGHAAAFDSTAALAVVLALRGAQAVPDAAAGLSKVEPSPGRMIPRALQGGIYVLDDAYNGNPESTAESLRTLMALAGAEERRALAVLGDMKELGAASSREHARIGELAVRLGVDVLVGCGPEMAHATAAAARLSAGRLAAHPTRVAHVLDPMHAIPLVRSLWRAGDVVLVKGSRSMNMERVVDGLCAEDEGRA
jgi:UDP-N-acetylmuramoyl-tripeptide--D-alanyl-D-alanine ligase